MFTTLFALGLFLIQMYVDDIHLDPDCVLHGQLETAAWPPTPDPSSGFLSGVPPEAIKCAIVLLVNLGLVALFFKELKISAFDPALATTMGINSHLMHYGLMALTAATVVSAFESVGSILVIAMLIAPAATAYLLTDRLAVMIALSMVVATLCALLGHIFAMTLPAMIFQPLGFSKVEDAKTAGCIAATSGILFLLALLLGPRHGLFSKQLERARLQLRHSRMELLCLLARIDQLDLKPISPTQARSFLSQFGGISYWFAALTVSHSNWLKLTEVVDSRLQVTAAGREFAESHSYDSPLWEAAIAKQFGT